MQFNRTKWSSQDESLTIAGFNKLCSGLYESDINLENKPFVCSFEWYFGCARAREREGGRVGGNLA